MNSYLYHIEELNRKRAKFNAKNSALLTSLGNFKDKFPIYFETEEELKRLLEDNQDIKVYLEFKEDINAIEKLNIFQIDENSQRIKDLFQKFEKQ